MFVRFFLVFFVSYLMAQNTTSLAVGASNGAATIFPIDPMDRGKDLVSMFSTLSSAPYKTTTSQIALQTTRNGLIPNVQALSPSTYSTLLTVTYKITSILQYVVVPVEQIVELVYSPVAIPFQATFTSSISGGALPIFSVDLMHRAVDIQNVVTTLLTTAPFKTVSSKVGLQTTLSGPFYLSFTNGFIPDIQSISMQSAAKGTLLLVNYKFGFLTTNIVVGPDQIFGIVYSTQ